MANGFFITSAATSILSSRINANTEVGLSTTTPTKSGNNFTEPSADTGYTRRKLGNVDTSIGGQVANGETIFMFEALKDCGTFTHLGLFSSGLTLVAELTSPISVPATYVPLIRKHKLVVGLDKEVLDTYD